MAWWGTQTPRAGGEDMARTSASAANSTLVSLYVQKLKAAGTDRSAFDGVVSELTTNAELKAAEYIAIADKFAIPVRRIASKKAALEAISKRFVELVRSQNKNLVASKARPF